MPKSNPIDTFYDFPTPANAIALAIADHEHGSKMPSHIFLSALRRAEKIVEQNRRLIRALENSTAALETYLPCGCREQPSLDVINADGDGFDEQKIADEARSILAAVGV